MNMKGYKGKVTNVVMNLVMDLRL